MSKPITLRSPKYRVILGDPADPGSWEEVEIQSMTRDLAAAEAHYQRRRWGDPSATPIRLTAVAAYQALLRAGMVSGTWEDFERSYVEVSTADDPEDEEEIHPTEAGADPA